MSDEEREDAEDSEESPWALPPFGALVAALGEVDEDDEADEERAQIKDIDRISISLAIELAVDSSTSGGLRVHGSTPTQWTETTVMPVFHKLTMHIERDTDGEE